MKSLHITTRDIPCLPQVEKAYEQKQGPSIAEINRYCLKKKNKTLENCLAVLWLGLVLCSTVKKRKKQKRKQASGAMESFCHTGNAYFLGGSDGKESACTLGDLGSMLGLGKSPEEGNGYPLQYSCLENSMDRGVWWARVHGISKRRTWLSD